MARCSTRGPCAAVRRGRQARRGVDRDVGSFSPGQEVLSKSPAPPHGLAGHGCPASAKRGGLLFWLLFSWPRKRKVTRAAKRFETLLILRAGCAPKTSKSERRWTPAFAGVTAREMWVSVGSFPPCALHHDRRTDLQRRQRQECAQLRRIERPVQLAPIARIAQHRHPRAVARSSSALSSTHTLSKSGARASASTASAWSHRWQ